MFTKRLANVGRIGGKRVIHLNWWWLIWWHCWHILIYTYICYSRAYKGLLLLEIAAWFIGISHPFPPANKGRWQSLYIWIVSSEREILYSWDVGAFFLYIYWIEKEVLCGMCRQLCGWQRDNGTRTCFLVIAATGLAFRDPLHASFFHLCE